MMVLLGNCRLQVIEASYERATRVAGGQPEIAVLVLCTLSSPPIPPGAIVAALAYQLAA